MKTAIKQIQQIVSLLKQYNVRHLVLSPGTRHVPLVHIAETDPFFHCYSIVDERSAAFFALGLSEALDEPVGFACTSSTASCNYMPAMKEAYERNIQLVALTSDKARYQRFHGISQVIDQVDMYQPYSVYSVDLPDVKNSLDEWYCNRCLNEALLEMNHKRKGPIQINFLEPLDIGLLASFTEGDMPMCRKIDRIESDNLGDYWKNLLRSKKRILVVCGQYQDLTGKLSQGLQQFRKSYRSVITYDNFSNVSGEGFIQSSLLGATISKKEVSNLKPDLIISFGTKQFSDLIFKFGDKNIEHWDINPDGRIYDTTHSLTKVFECTPELFFEKIAASDSHNDMLYEKEWIKVNNARNNDVSDYTNYYVAKRILESLPSNSNVHASVLNSMKFVNLAKLPAGTIATGNIGTDGIDGALSTFIGQSKVLSGLSLLVIGDLSYLYDLNASLTEFSNNVRILLINNQAGGEFHFNIGKHKISTLDMHIAAGHHTKIGDTLAMTNLHYLCAHSKEELETVVPDFLHDSSTPILLEVFTNAEKDGESLRNLFGKNKPKTLSHMGAQIINKVFGPQMKNKIKEIIYG